MTAPTTSRLVTGVLVALSLFILRDVLFFDRAFFERDLGYIYFAQIESFVRAIAEGALPLRDPSIGFGQSLIGNPESQVLYPLTWLHLILPPTRAFSLIVLCHFVIGATGAAALAARFLPSGQARFLAGAFWITSGPFQSTLNVHHFAGTSWMPWILVAFDRFLDRATIRRAAALGALFGIQILGGSADVCVITLLLALFRLLCDASRRFTWLGRRRLLGILAALTVGLCLGAGTWMPVVEILGNSSRSDLPRESRTEWSIHPFTMTELGLPIQAGTLPLTPEASARFNDSRPPFLKSLFMGSLVLPLLLAGLLSPSIRRRQRLFLGGGAVFALLYALGKHAPFYDLIVALLPPLRLFRFPAKAAIPLSLLLSLLAAIGAASLQELRVRRLCAGLSIVLAALNAWLYWDLAKALQPFLDQSRSALVLETISEAGPALLISALLLTVFAFALWCDKAVLVRLCVLTAVPVGLFANRGINPTVSSRVMEFRPSHVDLLKQGTVGRVYAFDYLHYPARSAQIFNRGSLIVPETVQGLDPPSAFIVVIRSALMPPTGAAWALEYGWDADLRGLFDRPLREMTAHLQAVDGTASALRLLQIANVTHVVALHTSSFGRLVLEHTIPLPLPEPLYIYRVPEPLPRAYAVGGVRLLPTSDAELAILDPNFDPTAEVVLESGSPRAISAAFSGSLRITERRSDRTSLEATLNEPGQIVLVEGFLPGWRATVDDVAAPVQRANALFLSAPVPKGRHRVVFTYRPVGAMLGLTVSAVTAVLLAVFATRRVCYRP